MDTQQSRQPEAERTHAEPQGPPSRRKLRHGPSTFELILPGDVQAWYEAPLYARVSGYLKNWYFDYGAEIKKGQVLAEIDAPDLDAQLAAG